MFPETRRLLREFLARFAQSQAEAMLVGVYLVAVGPVALWLRVSGGRMLPGSFGSGRSHWLARRPVSPDPQWLSRQY